MEKIYTCNICHTTSDVSPFYVRVTSRCKECHKAKVRENRKAKAEYYREYDAHRYQNDPKVKERHERYRKSDAGKAAMGKSRAKWHLKNPEKRAAHYLLNNAIRDGRAIKPATCSRCGAGGRIEGHHHDYTKPLDVVWLCRQCHVDEHREDE